MASLKTGLFVALVQVLLVASVGAKFLVDRIQYPKVWIAAQPYDPNLPIRGRYVSLSAIVKLDDPAPPTAAAFQYKKVRLTVRNDALVAIPDERGHQNVRTGRCGTEQCWVLAEPMAYFIPEHIGDPSRRKAGEELWVEATIPPNGPPRPIRLGVKSDGKMSVLDIQ